MVSPMQDAASLIPNKFAMNRQYVTSLGWHIGRHVYIVSNQNSSTVAKLQQESLMLAPLPIIGQKLLDSCSARSDNLSRLL